MITTVLSRWRFPVIYVVSSTCPTSLVKTYKLVNLLVTSDHSKSIPYGSFNSSLPFSIGLQSSLASWSFPMTWPFASGGQSIEASASTSVLPMNILGWFPLGLTSLISWQSKRLSKVFSSTIIQKNQFVGTQSSLWLNTHICTWLLEKP